MTTLYFHPDGSKTFAEFGDGVEPNFEYVSKFVLVEGASLIGARYSLGEDNTLVDNFPDLTDDELGLYLAKKEEIPVAELDPKTGLENRLRVFAAEKDISIDEIGMLLNSTNPEWKAEAQHFQDLYLRSWEAFYAGDSLPELVW